jgi:hypothetical protein
MLSKVHHRTLGHPVWVYWKEERQWYPAIIYEHVASGIFVKWDDNTATIVTLILYKNVAQWILKDKPTSNSYESLPVGVACHSRAIAVTYLEYHHRALNCAVYVYFPSYKRYYPARIKEHVPFGIIVRWNAGGTTSIIKRSNVKQWIVKNKPKKGYKPKVEDVSSSSSSSSYPFDVCSETLTGYRGVYSSSDGTFRADLKIGDVVQTSSGCYYAEEAAAAYDQLIRTHHGNMTELNFPNSNSHSSSSLSSNRKRKRRAQEVNDDKEEDNDDDVDDGADGDDGPDSMNIVLTPFGPYHIQRERTSDSLGATIFEITCRRQVVVTSFSNSTCHKYSRGATHSKSKLLKESGVQVGDIIQRVNKAKIESLSDFVQAIQGKTKFDVYVGRRKGFLWDTRNEKWVQQPST